MVLFGLAILQNTCIMYYEVNQITKDGVGKMEKKNEIRYFATFLRWATNLLLAAFLLFGGLVGLYYGGYTGLLFASRLVGPAEGSLLVRILVLSGVVVGAILGTLANLAIFLVIAVTLKYVVTWASSLVAETIQPEATETPHR